MHVLSSIQALCLTLENHTSYCPPENNTQEKRFMPQKLVHLSSPLISMVTVRDSQKKLISFQEPSVGKQTDNETPLPRSWLVVKSDGNQILHFHWLAINKELYNKWSSSQQLQTKLYRFKKQGRADIGSDCFLRWNRFVVLLSFFASLSVSSRYHA